MKGRYAKTFLIGTCLSSGLVLGYSYKGNLLSQIVKKQYETPIDNVQGVLDSGLQVYIPARTSIYHALKGDPRKDVQKFMKSQAKTYPFVGVIPQWIIES